MPPDYEFTADWFSHVESVWEQLLTHITPSRVLEIGSYEGRSACFLIERIAAERPLEIRCIDSWSGALDDADGIDLAAVEDRFDRNTAAAIARAAHPVALHKIKGASHLQLAKLLAAGEGGFDLVYVDGSHHAPDVLADAVLGFHLLGAGGMMIFDDYLWPPGPNASCDHYRMPKPAIDAFVNIYRQQLELIRAPLYQLFVRKL